MEKILVADDNDSVRELLTCLLTSRGYEVATAADGLQAIDEIAEFRPDLVLLDIQMPGLDGTEVCREMKSHAETRQIPVVLISALADTAAHARRVGADGFVRKPFSMNALTEEVVRCLARIPSPREGATAVRESRVLATMNFANLCATGI